MEEMGEKIASPENINIRLSPKGKDTSLSLTVEDWSPSPGEVDAFAEFLKAVLERTQGDD